MALLEVKDLAVYFKTTSGNAWLRAVDGVSFEVQKGESLGLVGESGCGKTTIGNTIVGLVRPKTGSIRFEGRDVVGLGGSALKAFRRQVQMVFQDPFGALNPRMSIGAVIAEILKVHKLASGRAQRAEITERLLRSVGLEPEYAARYPHEFSGGQRQRIGIARALAVNPSLIVADEPVSALDVSVQVQILNLMKDLQAEMGLSYLFIAHDLAVVRYMCPRTHVMYLGKIVESGPSDELFSRPAHPYTEALLSAVPDVDKGLQSRNTGSQRIVLKGDVPSPTSVIPGCPFHPRCHRVQDICREVEPDLKTLGPSHTSVCHFAEQLFADAQRGGGKGTQDARPRPTVLKLVRA
ncbi:MAG: peptide ABC transporter substrate-binding protein [Verrucomicrobia bacterium]|nr:peptide ABC transporter substrate-binding protein [Verrucomicrobiota bacterium]